MKDVQKIKRAGRSLNLILWFCFSLFALLIVVVYAVLQNVFVRQRTKERMENLLRDAGRTIAEAAMMWDGEEAPGKILDLAGDYGVKLYLIYPNGECVYPQMSGTKSYPAIAEDMNLQLSAKDEAVFYENDRLSYGARLTVQGNAVYLMISDPAGTAGVYGDGQIVMTVLTGLFSVVLAFAVSGVVSLLITRPVTDVTEQAKELARGHYDLNLRKDYFCSELSDLSEALDHARSEISKADVVQKELIANVSHDFKTPLTMIKAYASMIREISGDDKEKRDAHAKIIIDECDRLTVLVGDLLDLSKLRAGVGSDMGTVFNLSEVVYNIAARFEYLCDTEGYTIETEVEDEQYTFACRERIEQVLYNLIGNAVNYTGADKRVRVRLFKKGHGTRFEVIDTGKGIPPEEIDTIWDRYYRSASSHKRPVSGSGLGLSIVKNILLRQDCPFGVVSERGKGSCFWVEFPPPTQDRQTETEGKGNGKGKRG